MEVSSNDEICLNLTSQILKKFENKENTTSKISVSSSKSKKSINVEKTIEDYNQKFDFKF
jgi:hypothetical protein